jgi:hypothetical protein
VDLGALHISVAVCWYETCDEGAQPPLWPAACSAGLVITEARMSSQPLALVFVTLLSLRAKLRERADAMNAQPCK